MASELGVQTIQHTNGTDAITIDSSGDLTFNGSNTVTPTDSGWQDVTFESGYGNYGSPFPDVQYRKIGKVVYLKGLMDPATHGTAFTLPEGYRPPERQAIDVINNNSQGRIDIYPTGAVSCDNMTNQSSWVSLQFSFLVD